MVASDEWVGQPLQRCYERRNASSRVSDLDKLME